MITPTLAQSATVQKVVENVTKPPELKFGWGDKVFSFSGWGVIILLALLYMIDKKKPHIRKNIGRGIKNRINKALGRNKGGKR